MFSESTGNESIECKPQPIGIQHPKLKEYHVSDFLSIKEDHENLKGYDACFFCAGVSSVGMKEPEYTKITYDITLAFARSLNPKPQMTFAYISGAGTDSSEKRAVNVGKGKREDRK